MFTVSCFVKKPTFILHAFHTRWILPILQTMHHSIKCELVEFCSSKDFKLWCIILYGMKILILFHIMLYDIRHWFGHWPEHFSCSSFYLEWIKMKYHSDVGKILGPSRSHVKQWNLKTKTGDCKECKMKVSLSV